MAVGEFQEGVDVLVDKEDGLAFGGSVPLTAGTSAQLFSAGVFLEA
jgi:hypothetical protein